MYDIYVIYQNIELNAVGRDGYFSQPFTYDYDDDDTDYNDVWYEQHFFANIASMF